MGTQYSYFQQLKWVNSGIAFYIKLLHLLFLIKKRANRDKITLIGRNKNKNNTIQSFLQSEAYFGKQRYTIDFNEMFFTKLEDYPMSNECVN